jgi:Ca-activated chloride channel family protein
MKTRRYSIWNVFVIAIIAALLFSGCTKTEVPTKAPERSNEVREQPPRRIQETVVVERQVEREVTKVVETEVMVTREPRTQPQAHPTRVVVEPPRMTATPAPQATPVPIHGGQELPNEEPYDSMFFEHEGVNPFIDTEDDHFSTFAMDVDTASYTIARRYVKDGNLPPQDAVRVEEFINYFDLAYPGPQDSQSAFAIHLEGAPSPFGGEGYHLLQVGIQGRRVYAEDRKDAVLTFVIDVSGSMQRENRLGMVKHALKMLVEELRPTDRVGIVAYGSRAFTVLRPTSARNKNKIVRAINGLRAGGSTYAEEGLRQGYKMAYGEFDEWAINRVILCSDGVANVGRTGADGILETIEGYAERGITLSTIGVGMGNYNDVLMENLADQGNGNYFYVDTLDEAERIFVDNLAGTLQVIAQDSKIQVDFNPDVVSRYRLLGYENRDVADEDFRNNDVDAGEVGAGHSVTALYEIKFHKHVDMQKAYERALTVYVRYEDPDWGDIVEVAREFWPDEFQAHWMETSPAFLLTASVAEYAEILRGSYWARDANWDDVLALAQFAGDELSEDELIGEDINEFIWLVKRVKHLSRNG